MDGSEPVEPTAVWRRRQVAGFWGVSTSTLDRWTVCGLPRLPAPRVDPAGKPFWLAAEVKAAAAAPDSPDDAAASLPGSNDQLSDDKALAILRRENQRRR